MYRSLAFIALSLLLVFAALLTGAAQPNSAGSGNETSWNEASEELQPSETKLDEETLKLISSLERRFTYRFAYRVMPVSYASIIDHLQQFFNINAEDIELSLRQINQQLEKIEAPEMLDYPAPSTGDEFLDRYFKTVEKRVRGAGLDQSAHFEPAAIPDDVLDEWLADFAADPRYWELRYFSLVLQQSDVSAGDEEPEYERYSFKRLTAMIDVLETARQRNAVQASTLLMLADLYDRYYEGQMEELSSSQPDSSTLLLMNERDDVVLELLDEAVALEPDYAWSWYRRAFYWFELGELEQAVADLARGNQAQRVSYPEPFPLSLLHANQAAGRLTGSIVVSGAIAYADISWPYPKIVEIKDHLRSTLVAINLGAGPEIANEWQQFGTRLAAAKPSNPIQWLAGDVMIFMLQRFFLEQPAVSAEQQATLAHIRGAVEEIKTAYRNIDDEYDAFLNTLTLTAINFPSGRFVSIHLELASLQRIYDQQVGPVFADLAQVRYPGLVLPDALLKYEPLSEE